MAKRDYYEVLGCERDAAESDLKKAYRRLAMQYHPDRNGGSTEADSAFKEAKEAHEVLSDQQKRATYDRYGHDGLQGNTRPKASAAPENFADIFSDIFGTSADGYEALNKEVREKQNTLADLRDRLQNIDRGYKGFSTHLDLAREGLQRQREGAQQQASYATAALGQAAINLMQWAQEESRLAEKAVTERAEKLAGLKIKLDQIDRVIALGREGQTSEKMERLKTRLEEASGDQYQNFKIAGDGFMDALQYQNRSIDQALQAIENLKSPAMGLMPKGKRMIAALNEAQGLAQELATLYKDNEALLKNPDGMFDYSIFPDRNDYARSELEKDLRKQDRVDHTDEEEKPLPKPALDIRSCQDVGFEQTGMLTGSVSPSTLSGVLSEPHKKLLEDITYSSRFSSHYSSVTAKEAHEALSPEALQAFEKRIEAAEKEYTRRLQALDELAQDYPAPSFDDAQGNVIGAATQVLRSNFSYDLKKERLALDAVIARAEHMVAKEYPDYEAGEKQVSHIKKEDIKIQGIHQNSGVTADLAVTPEQTLS